MNLWLQCAHQISFSTCNWFNTTQNNSWNFTQLHGVTHVFSSSCGMMLPSRRVNICSNNDSMFLQLFTESCHTVHDITVANFIRIPSEFFGTIHPYFQKYSEDTHASIKNRLCFNTYQVCLLSTAYIGSILTEITLSSEWFGTLSVGSNSKECSSYKVFKRLTVYN